jgi:two-component system chemotaxis response regulator CheY
MARNTILVVDDECPIRRVIRLTLTRAGYDVIEAEDDVAAIETMQTGEPADLPLAVICDLDMPRMGGAQTIEVLRARFPSIPVLVVTGKPDMPLALSLIKKGIAGYLLKPITPEELIAALETAAARLGVSSGRPRSERPTTHVYAGEANATPLIPQLSTRIKCTWKLWLRNVIAILLLPSAYFSSRCSCSRARDDETLRGRAVIPLNHNEIGDSD